MTIVTDIVQSNTAIKWWFTCQSLIVTHPKKWYIQIIFKMTVFSLTLYMEADGIISYLWLTHLFQCKLLQVSSWLPQHVSLTDICAETFTSQHIQTVRMLWRNEGLFHWGCCVSTEMCLRSCLNRRGQEETPAERYCSRYKRETLASMRIILLMKSWSEPLVTAHLSSWEHLFLLWFSCPSSLCTN